MAQLFCLWQGWWIFLYFTSLVKIQKWKGDFKIKFQNANQFLARARGLSPSPEKFSLQFILSYFQKTWQTKGEIPHVFKLWVCVWGGGVFVPIPSVWIETLLMAIPSLRKHYTKIIRKFKFIPNLQTGPLTQNSINTYMYADWLSRVNADNLHLD
jgi:hypothetical protein